MPRSDIAMPRQMVRNFGTCLEFNGSSSYVLKSTETAYNLVNYSIEVWIKANKNTFSNDSRIYAEGSSSSGNPFFNINAKTTGGVTVGVRDDANSTLLAGNSTNLNIFDDKWHQLVWVDQGGTATLYIDGVADATSFSYTRGTLTLNRTAVGALVRTSVSNYFKGKIDKVRVYNTALTQDQVNNLYYQGSLISGQVINWEMDEGSGATVTDSSGNGSNGDMTGHLATYSGDVFMVSRTSV